MGVKSSLINPLYYTNLIFTLGLEFLKRCECCV